MRICLVSAGLEERNQRLQPWRYLLQTAQSLSESGHDVHLLSDGSPHLPTGVMLGGLPLTRLARVADWPLHGNPALVRVLEVLSPDIVLWHLGLTGFLRLSTPGRLPVPVIGLFTSPIYRPKELLLLGPKRLLGGWRLTAIHLLGLLVPGLLLRRAFRRRLLHGLVVECETTKVRLVELGVPIDSLHVIRPGIDPAWFEVAPSPAERVRVRRELGYSARDTVVGYFGPPTSLRGLPTLIEATAIAREWEPAIKLLALSRRRDGELDREQRAIEKLVKELGAEPWAQIETGFLAQERLISTLAACDLMVLPFELVPSDVPLSVLEAIAMERPLITSDVACLPELVPDGRGLRVPPAEPAALAQAILAFVAQADLGQRLAKEGREWALAWNMLSQMETAWNRLLHHSLFPRPNTRSGPG